MKKIYITGASGTGKSTIAKELNKRNIFSFDIDMIDGLCSWINKKTLKKPDYSSGVSLDWLEAHDFVCDTAKLKKLLDVKKEIVVAVGVATNQDEYLPLFDRIFVLQCKETTFLNRLNKRTSNEVFGKSKDEQKFILDWYKNFENHLIANGAIPISTDNTIDETVNEIISKI